MKTLCVIAAMLLAITAPATAGISVAWSTGGAFANYLGWDGQTSDPQGWDTVQLFPDPPFNTLTLEWGVPQDVVINPLTFGVGVNRQSAIDWGVFPMTRDITVNGITQSLVSRMHLWINTSDTLLVLEGPSVRFGNIKVTPLGWAWADRLVNPGEYQSSDVHARFELVPVPAAVLLGVIGLGLVGWIKRRLA